MNKALCPVCHGAKTHVVKEEEKLCFLCNGEGKVPVKIIHAIQRRLKQTTPPKT